MKLNIMPGTRFLISRSSQETVRFCLSNGRSWVFAFLKKEADGRRAYYEAPPCYLEKMVVQLQNADSLRSVQMIVELVLEWVSTARGNK